MKTKLIEYISKNLNNLILKTIFKLLLISIVVYFFITSCKKDKTPDTPVIKIQTITVNPSEVIATGVRNKYGINLNAMHDNDENRPTARPISEALIELGVKHLRFPGGGKSNRYYWTADSDNPDPTTNYFIGWYGDASTGAGESLLNFDQFITICKQIGATPHVNVAVPLPGEDGNSGLTVALAAAWVKYANITKDYGVKYWEIGNENWGLNVSDDSLANIYYSYASAMKAVDPSIIIMAGGHESEVSAAIHKCGSLLDVITAGSYPCYAWGSYDYYPTNSNLDLLGTDFISTIAATGRKTVFYEFNAIDWANSFEPAKAWLNTNDLGHGLVVFEIVGQILTNKDIIYGNFWNTRWNAIWDNYSYSNYDALDKDNQLLAVGKPLAVWGKFIKDNMVSISRTNTIVTYACYDSNTGALNLFLSNKSTFPQTVSLAVTSTNKYSSGEIWQLKGKGSSDTNPVWGKTDNTTVTDNKIGELVLPAVSITVVSISK